jgi:putative membrane protein
MKYKTLFLCLSLFLIPSSQILALNDMHESKGSSVASSTPQAKSLSGKVIETLITINKNEIALAKEALSRRDLNPTVRQFAEKLYRDHMANLVATQRLSRQIGMEPERSSFSMSLAQKGSRELNKMKTLNTQAFQIAYTEAMVKGHEGALKILDKGIEDVRNPQLKKHLLLTRDTVMQHLKMAKMLEPKNGS